MTLLHLIEVLLVGIMSGFVGAIAGGGGLISIPFLLFLGVPPQVTLATNKLGGLGLSAGALFKFIRGKKIVWRYTIGLALMGTLASFIGAKILLSTEGSPLNTLIGVLLLLAVPTMFMKKGFGVHPRATTERSKLIGYAIYFCISIIASFFGGIGALLIANVVYFFGLPMIEANATELVAYTVMSVSSVLIFAFNDLIDYRFGVVLIIGMMLGGYLGAHAAIKKGNSWVKIVFAMVIIASAVKILLS